jgi:hypothetical protein
MDFLKRFICKGLIAAWAVGFVAVAGTITPALGAPPYGTPGFLLEGPYEDLPRTHPLNRKYYFTCATNYQLRKAVAAQGFTNIYIGGNIGTSGNREMRATRDGVVYLLEVDKCTGKVESMTPLRKVQ